MPIVLFIDKKTVRSSYTKYKGQSQLTNWLNQVLCVLSPISKLKLIEDLFLVEM